MDSPKITYKYYSNPAFCAQSEVVFSQQTPCVTPRILQSPMAMEHRRMSPLGANSPRKQQTEQPRANNRTRTDISDNPLRMSQYKGEVALRLVRASQDAPPELPPKPHYLSRTNSNASFRRRQTQIRRSRTPNSADASTRSRSKSEDLEMSQLSRKCYSDQEEDERGISLRVSKHRYEEIPDLEDVFDNYSPTKKRIVESEVDEYNVDAADESEFKEIPTEIVKTVNGKLQRYAIVPLDDEDEAAATDSDSVTQKSATFTSQPMTRKNMIATQKLHELLSTPKKTPTLKSYASQPSVHHKQVESPIQMVVFPATPSKRVVSSTPMHGITPSKSCANLNMSPSPRNQSATSPNGSRAQQRLNYGAVEPGVQRFSPPKQNAVANADVFVRASLYNRSAEFDRNRSFNRGRSFERDRTLRDSQRKLGVDRSMAVITPRLAQELPPQYSDDEEEVGAVTYKSSWSSTRPPSPAAASLAIAALMMTLCGALAAGLSFYMMYDTGRVYYLDFGVLSGFTCLFLGLLGFKSRTYQLLPNRNYISGYILLSSFSLLSCAGLLVLLVARPPAGSALREVTATAVCGLAALALLLAAGGALASACCARPPPDNRVGRAQRTPS